MARSYPLTEYRPQGLGHVFGLSGITALGLGIFGFTGSALLAVPIGVGVCLQLYRSAGKTKDPDWCNALGEMWTYKLSPRHRSLEQDYDTWCEQYGLETVNAIIDPLVGQCCYANFSRDPKHPYHGLRGVLVFDCEGDGLPPLTPHDYVAARLRQRMAVFARGTVDVEAVTVLPQVEKSAEPPEQILCGQRGATPCGYLGAIAPTNSAEISNQLVEISNQSALELPTSETVSEVHRPAPPWIQPGQTPNVLEFALSLTQAPLQPVIFVGPQGSGKGMAAAIALTLGKIKNGLEYWVFNPKPAIQEAGYWQEAKYHFLKNRLDLNDTRMFPDLMNVLGEFAKEGDRRNQVPGPHPPMVLLLEEINAIVGGLTGTQRQEFKVAVSGLASMLRNVNMSVWLSGQSINLEELGLGSRTTRASFKIIVVVAEDHSAVAPICDLLGLEFDPGKLGAGDRHWLVGKDIYPAPPAPTIRQYSTWSEVPNLIDLRATKQSPPSQKQPTDEELWADYQHFDGSDRQWTIKTLGGEGGSYYRKLEALKERFGAPQPALL